MLCSSSCLECCFHTHMWAPPCMPCMPCMPCFFQLPSTCWKKKKSHSFHPKESKKPLFFNHYVPMVQEHRFRLPQIPCSNIKVIMKFYSFTEKESHKSSINSIVGYIREVEQRGGRDFSIDPRYYLMGLVKASVS